MSYTHKGEEKEAGGVKKNSLWQNRNRITYKSSIVAISYNLNPSGGKRQKGTEFHTSLCYIVYLKNKTM